ncbi:MAG TPA: hypothetical protein VKQ11_21135 [Candidatus Sulfotelmatobacter sp.]|nr:hypothetical protein [Candidatus Sulfotelmatobacter sp.]
MTLKSALQDIKETTLSAISGLLGKLSYLASLRRGHGRYEHWGMQIVHGEDASERALKTAHVEVVARVLQTPLGELLEDLKESSQSCGVPPQAYVEQMRDRFDALLPEGRNETPASTHLNSVLLALSHLQQNRERATRSTS